MSNKTITAITMIAMIMRVPPAYTTINVNRGPEVPLEYSWPEGITRASAAQ
jgi:hypothetical protein